MAVASAKVLGGSLRLSLGQHEVAAVLTLPHVEAEKSALLLQKTQENPKNALKVKVTDRLRALAGMEARKQEGSSSGGGGGGLSSSSSSSSSTWALQGTPGHSRALQEIQDGEEPQGEGDRDVRHLTFAIAGDSQVRRKVFHRDLQRAFPHATLSVVAGDTWASIENLVDDVIDADCDVFITDQDFGVVHERLGTDMVAELRARDAIAGTSRLILVASANDEPEDVQMYLEAGANGIFPKASNSTASRSIILRHAEACPRFEGRITRRGDVPGSN